MYVVISRLGLHPDEATEPLVDVALGKKKLFVK